MNLLIISDDIHFEAVVSDMHWQPTALEPERNAPVAAASVKEVTTDAEEALAAGFGGGGDGTVGMMELPMLIGEPWSGGGIGASVPV